MKSTLIRVLLLSLFTISVTRAEEKPNIIFIMVDDLGRHDISFYGHHQNGVETPNIDSIFEKGVSFNNFYANSPVCSPTRAALMTGLYPDRAGVPGVIRQKPSESWGYLRRDISLLPAELKKQGYHTSMVGKWHLGYDSPNLPNERGFDSFHGFLGDMMDNYETHLRGGVNWMRKNRETINPTGHATDLFTTWAVDEIKSLSKAGSPFFLYLAFNAPHDPIQPGKAWLDRVRKRSPELSEKRSALAALIEQMDDGVGRVLETVRNLGTEKKTLIVFTSDNGGQMSHGADNGPWRGTKGETFDGGLRVVCAAQWAEHIPSGQKTDAPAATFDWFPTLIEIAGGDISKMSYDGASLKNALYRPDELASYQDRELYFVRREGGPAYAGKTIEALRRGPWKLVLNSPFEPARLFHLGDDPYEKRDIAAENPSMKREMIERLQFHIQRGGAFSWQPSK